MTLCRLVAGGAYLEGTLDYLDCQAQAIGQYGYQMLAGPASLLSPALTVALTLFIALFGYRALFGHTPSIREGVMAVVKIGAVLTLATSWPAFHILAYDVAMHAPAQLASQIGGPAQLPGAAGGLVRRLQGVDDELAELTLLGAGSPAGVAANSENEAQPASQQAGAQPRPARWNSVYDAAWLGDARAIYLTTTIGGFAAVRLVAALLLSLAPLFAIFLLFDSTRGFFEGWLRGLVGASLGAVAVSIVLGVELALLEPWLATAITQRRAGIPTPDVAIQMFATATVFALAMLAALAACAWIVRGFRLPRDLTGFSWPSTPAPMQAAASSTIAQPGASAQTTQRSRAVAIAEAAVAAERRDHAMIERGTASAGGGAAHMPSPGGRFGASDPLGARRRTSLRTTRTGGRRDRI